MRISFHFFGYIYILYMFHYFIFEKRATFTTIITLQFHEQFLSRTKKIHCVQQFHNPKLSVTLGNSIWRFKWWKFLADLCFCLRPRIYFRILLTLFSVHSLEKTTFFHFSFQAENVSLCQEMMIHLCRLHQLASSWQDTKSRLRQMHSSRSYWMM